MINQIIIGTFVIILTIVIQVIFIGMSIQALTKHGKMLASPPHLYKTIIALLGVVLWLIVGISLSAWAWAGVFLIADAFQSLEPALYFSIVSFTTLGYGDITLSSEWRILASFSAVNGLIIFGLNTAFLVEFTNRLRNAQEQFIQQQKSTLE